MCRTHAFEESESRQEPSGWLVSLAVGLLRTYGPPYAAIAVSRATIGTLDSSWRAVFQSPSRHAPFSCGFGFQRDNFMDLPRDPSVPSCQRRSPTARSETASESLGIACRGFFATSLSIYPATPPQSDRGEASPAEKQASVGGRSEAFSRMLATQVDKHWLE